MTQNPVRTMLNVFGFTCGSLARLSGVSEDVVKQAAAGSITALPAALADCIEGFGISEAQAQYAAWFNRAPYFCGVDRRLPEAMEMLHACEAWEKSLGQQQKKLPEQQSPQLFNQPPHMCGSIYPFPLNA